MQDWSGTKVSRVAIQRREEYIESEPKAAVAPVVRGGGSRRSQIDADVGEKEWKVSRRRLFGTADEIQEYMMTV